MIFRKNHKYFIHKATLDKASNQNTAYQIQLYNDRLIDKYVESFSSDEDLTVKPTVSQLWAELSILNRPDVYNNYQKIINSKYTSNDAIDNIIIKNKANKDLNRIVEAEVERISKNLDYVEQVMRKYNAPFKEYERRVREQKANSVGNRQRILKDVAIKSNELLVSDGLNIPSNVYSYRNLEATAENLLRQSQMISKHEKINAINENAISEGKDKVYNGKEWIWTGAGKTTRHASNHLQKRQVNEPFIIVNDATLEIDDLMYPSDPDGSYSNTFICYCEVEYLTEGVDDLGYKVTIPSSVKPVVNNPVTVNPTPVTPSKPVVPSTIGIKTKPTKETIKPTESAKTINPRIAELEKEINEVQSIAEKWKSRGNTDLAKTFENDVKKLKEELESLKNQTTKQTTKTTTENTPQDAMINNILSDVLKDVGLEDIAPEKKYINPNVKVKKNIETTHKSNLWENLAEKHGLELREASETRVTFYDKEFETPIQCNILKNKDWIDYTNSGQKKINIEDILDAYTSAEDIQKKATPIIMLQSKSTDQGSVTISRDKFYLELFEGAFYKMEGSINGGNIKGAMHHEMWHCVDIRMTPEDDARVLQVLNSNIKGSKYKKNVTKDRRSRKKTGGQNFVSAYARQSGSGNKVYEDFAESGSIMTSDTFLVADAIGGYEEISKAEFIKRYPNRAKYIQDIIDNGELLW